MPSRKSSELFKFQKEFFDEIVFVTVFASSVIGAGNYRLAKINFS